MSKSSYLTTLFAGILVQNAWAGSVTNVPEIDGGVAVLALGLTVGVIALFRERRKEK